MRSAMRLHIHKAEDGYTRYTIQYLGFPSYILKPFRIVNSIICFDFFENGVLSEYDVPNGTMLGTNEVMGLIQGIIPQCFMKRNKDIIQVA